ncbi:hypothetical protein VNI00_018254 [Paramarasmius palmivorus]|uniref:Uncharacterized protein n=1 Tax=Paramarasmius palmivorus TaxID=297713 RepID=A0AAW0B139_9AGAR
MPQNSTRTGPLPRMQTSRHSGRANGAGKPLFISQVRPAFELIDPSGDFDTDAMLLFEMLAKLQDRSQMRLGFPAAVEILLVCHKYNSLLNKMRQLVGHRDYVAESDPIQCALNRTYYDMLLVASALVHTSGSHHSWEWIFSNLEISELNRLGAMPRLTNDNFLTYQSKQLQAAAAVENAVSAG